MFGRVGTTLTHLRKSEVAEAMIATWCIEFLRVRRLGGFHVVEIVVISALMLGVRTIVKEAGRRRDSGKVRTHTMSVRTTQMDSMGIDERTPGSSGRIRRSRRYK